MRNQIQGSQSSGSHNEFLNFVKSERLEGSQNKIQIDFATEKLLQKISDQKINESGENREIILIPDNIKFAVETTEVHINRILEHLPPKYALRIFQSISQEEYQTNPITDEALRDGSLNRESSVALAYSLNDFKDHLRYGLKLPYLQKLDENQTTEMILSDWKGSVKECLNLACACIESEIERNTTNVQQVAGGGRGEAPSGSCNCFAYMKLLTGALFTRGNETRQSTR